MKLIFKIIATFLPILLCSSCSSEGVWEALRNAGSLQKKSGLSENSGTLDVRFSSDGTADFSVKPELNLARKIIADSSGRLLITGETNILQSNTSDMFLIRLNSDGSLDTSFNSGGATPGVFLHNNAGGGGQSDGGYSVAVDSNGRIIVAGYSDTDASGTFDTAMTLWRLNDNGTPDTTFNAGSFIYTVSTPVDNGNHSARELKIDTDGDYYITGFGRSSGAGNDMVVWRIRPGSGNPSVTWNVADNNAAGGNADDIGLKLVLSGNAIFVGGSSSRGTFTNATFWKLQKNNGDLDTAFNSGGRLSFENLAGGTYSGSDFTASIETTSSGEFSFSVKSQLNSNFEFRAVTGILNSAGSLLTYGNSGLSNVSIPGYMGYAATGGSYESLCGCIITTGMATSGISGIAAMTMLDSNGTLNSDFGAGDGVVLIAGPENFTSIVSVVSTATNYYLAGYSLDSNTAPTTGKIVIYSLIR
ncbi:MAG: hypothetical protein KDK41_05100 [Leptospiraceae bacterium]|nr:hypothetical protein [Leptospiraceae bacterium]